jgi:biopolymer transport protein ExbB/TolQ
LFVHLHREAGLAHRHYVLKPWQVRVLAILTSRVMLVMYVLGLVTWGWMAGQAAQVPFLRHELSRFESDSVRLDSLSATLTELQSRYDQVQRMLSATTAQQAAAAADTERPPAGPQAPTRPATP